MARFATTKATDSQRLDSAEFGAEDRYLQHRRLVQALRAHDRAAPQLHPSAPMAGAQHFAVGAERHIENGLVDAPFEVGRSQGHVGGVEAGARLRDLRGAVRGQAQPERRLRIALPHDVGLRGQLSGDQHRFPLRRLLLRPAGHDRQRARQLVDHQNAGPPPAVVRPDEPPCPQGVFDLAEGPAHRLRPPCGHGMERAGAGRRHQQYGPRLRRPERRTESGAQQRGLSHARRTHQHHGPVRLRTRHPVEQRLRQLLASEEEMTLLGQEGPHTGIRARTLVLDPVRGRRVRLGRRRVARVGGEDEIAHPPDGVRVGTGGAPCSRRSRWR